jgi:uncharacterized membrane protein YkoI
MVACLTVSLGALAPHIASASDRGRDRDDDDRRPPERVMSLDEAMAQAEKRYRARAVHGEEKRKGDRIVYRIRLLDRDGRVFEVSIDAGSGRDR